MIAMGEESMATETAPEGRKIRGVERFAEPLVSWLKNETSPRGAIVTVALPGLEKEFRKQRGVSQSLYPSLLTYAPPGAKTNTNTAARPRCVFVVTPYDDHKDTKAFTKKTKK
jgi:hypothetical protein